MFIAISYVLIVVCRYISITLYICSALMIIMAHSNCLHSMLHQLLDVVSGSHSDMALLCLGISLGGSGTPLQHIS